MEAAAEPLPSVRGQLVALGPHDIGEMLELAEIAKPGPFGPRTYELGRYIGLREGGRLLAMGGERFHLPGFIELSAICVHPAGRGGGLGAAVTSHLARLAWSRGTVPFLHVFPDNPAINLYRKLGFRERARLWVIWQRRVSAAL